MKKMMSSLPFLDKPVVKYTLVIVVFALLLSVSYMILSRYGFTSENFTTRQVTSIQAPLTFITTSDISMDVFSQMNNGDILYVGNANAQNMNYAMNISKTNDQLYSSSYGLAPLTKTSLNTYIFTISNGSNTKSTSTFELGYIVDSSSPTNYILASRQYIVMTDYLTRTISTIGPFYYYKLSPDNPIFAEITNNLPPMSRVNSMLPPPSTLPPDSLDQVTNPYTNQGSSTTTFDQQNNTYTNPVLPDKPIFTQDTLPVTFAPVEIVKPSAPLNVEEKERDRRRRQRIDSQISSTLGRRVGSFFN